MINSALSEIFLDTSGYYCPEPLMMLHAQIAMSENGQIIKMLATDPATQRDIPEFCHFLKHELLNQKTESDRFCFWIKVVRENQKLRL